MKKISRMTVVALLAALGLSSCVDENQLQVWRSTAVGSLSGAALGVGVGAVAGGKKNRGKAMAIGAIAGALVGGAAAHVWARSQVMPRAQYTTPAAFVQANCAQLDSRIASARQTTQALSAKSSGSGRISAAELNQIKQANSANNMLIQQDITTARQAMAEATPSEQQRLTSQLEALEQERANMAAQIKALTALQS